MFRAVGTDGEPLVIYHGTYKGGFTEFNEAGGTGRGDRGTIMSDTLDPARRYVTRDRAEGIVLKRG